MTPASEEISAMNATYSREYCQSLSLAYGSNMMSEGGNDEIDVLVEGMDLDNKNVLDFGSGLGGLAFYLADKYNANVTGIEINPQLIELARSNAPKKVSDKVSFVLGDGSSLPFGDQSFEVVVSKGVISHLTHEQHVKTFAEFNRVLTTGGSLAIIDWLSPVQGVWGEEIQRIIESESLIIHAYNPENYLRLLAEAGFENLTFRDRSESCAHYNEEIVARLNSEPQKSEFIKKYGAKAWQLHVEGYNHIVAANKKGSLIIPRVAGTKK